MEIADITIIDANQVFSSEFLGGNNSKSLFTNKVGHGLIVNPGDKVSIYNSFIAEAGATTDAIEITEKFLGTREITYTQLTPINFINGSNEKPLGYERVSASNITETVNMNQNNIDILTNYYKTTNGENYFSLPRRFCRPLDGISGATGWDSTDSFVNGRCYNNGIVDTNVGSNEYNNGYQQAFVCEADYFFFSDNGSGVDMTAYDWKLKGDNSRYTIFVREDTRYGEQRDMISLSNSLVSETAAGAGQINGLFSSSEYPYVEYIEKLNINIKEGFVSPNALAENITNQLKEQQQPEINYLSSTLTQPNGAGLGAEGYETLLPMSVELNSKTYHTFFSAGVRLSNQVNWTEWNSKLYPGNPVLFNTSGTNNYLSQNQYIGVKRPDLFKAGRVWAANSTNNQPDTLTQAYFVLIHDLDEAQFRNSADINGSSGGMFNHTIPTYYEWGQPNAIAFMDYIRDIINAQGNYPELFENKFNQYKGHTNVNNSRFLHMNISRNGTDVGQRAAEISSIGWDYQCQGTSRAEVATKPEYKSVPLFFDYNPKYKNIDTEGADWETGYKYGIFKKVLYAGVYYVSFTTSHLGIGLDSVDVENFANTVGSQTIVMTGFNTNLFENDLTGGATGQIGGGAKVVDSGTGLGTGGFDSETGYVALHTPRYFLFTGSNTRIIRTKNIKQKIEKGGYVVLSFIQGNSANGGENPDNGEDLSLDIININDTIISTHIISFGSSNYVGALFTDYEHKLTDPEIASGVYIQIRQSSSSQSTFDTFGIRYFAVEQGFYDPEISRFQTSIPNPYFALNNGPANVASNNIIETTTNIGWDIHFNAYGNAHIGLFDGYLNRNYNESGTNTMLPGFKQAVSDINIPNFMYVNKIYLGSDNPLVEYNTITNRFEISNLHTPERVQNPFNALMSVSKKEERADIIPEFPTQGDIVYKINKRLYNNNYTPDMMPYNLNNFDINAQADDQNGAIIDAGVLNIYNLNQNLQGWNIFDQLTGIIIKDFGYTEQTWKESLFGIMGFSYEQFNSPATSLNDITTRVGNNNKNNLPYAFTNANVNSIDTIDFPTNTGGSSKYTLQIPITQQWNSSLTFPQQPGQAAGTTLPGGQWAGARVNSFPAITEAAVSVKLSAQTVPRAIRSGYYAIRSNIIDTPNFIGGPDSGFNYPILQCLSKVNDTNDWWVGGPSDIEYTFDKEKTITEITTAITTPDMRLASIEEGSSVLYKITRFRTDNSDIISQILGVKKEK